MNKYALLLTLSILIASMTTRAYEHGALHYTIEHGLPSNTIYNVIQDSKGYMWLCTDKGVARYNGITFETFTTFDHLPDNEIFFFEEDHQKRLWLATYNGELCYFKNDSFHTAANTPFLKLPFKRTYIQNITIAYDSSVAIAFDDRTKWVCIKGEQRVIYNFKNTITPDDTNYLYLQKQPGNKFRILYYNREVIIDDQSNKLDETYYSNGKTYRLSTAMKQQFLYNADSIYTLNHQALAPTNQAAYHNTIIYHLCRYDGSFFYCTSKGLFIDDNIQLFKDLKVSGVAPDNKGNIWVTTLGGGLYSLSKDFLKIRKYKDKYKGSIKYSFADSNALYYTTSNNNLYKLASGKTECLFDFSSIAPHKQKAKYAAAYLTGKDYTYYGLFDNYICKIENIASASPKTQMFFGKFFGGYKSLFLHGDTLFMKRFRTIDYFIFPKQKSDNRSVGVPVIKPAPYLSNRERFFGTAQDNAHSFWIATIDTMFKTTGNKAIAQPQFNNTHLRWFNHIHNHLIGYTHNNKLVAYDIDRNTVHANIAPDENCIWDKLYELDSNHLLISTNNLHRILTISPNGDSYAYHLQAIENPYVPTACEDICSDGKQCYFMKDGSITVFDINSLMAKSDPPGVFFKQLKTKNGTYHADNKIQIAYQESGNISISFSTLSFAAKNIYYQYSVSKTEDATDNWIDIKGDINLARTPPGTYNVKVRAKSISSSYSEPALLTLTILSPFWASWWFILVCVCLAAITGVLLIRYRVKTMLHKKQQTHETEIKQIRSEYKAMNALMNPHFIFNTLNNVQDLINKNDKKAANEYLRFFADLIRQNMYNISKEMIPLQKEIDLVTNYLLLEKLRFEDKLNYTIHIDDEIDLSEIIIPPLLIQPLVENSIKHGIYPLESKQGTIELNIYKQDNNIYIEVKDNGAGLEPADININYGDEPHGLGNIRQRIEQLNTIQEQDIRLAVSEIPATQEQCRWTVFTITIPLS